MYYKNNTVGYHYIVCSYSLTFISVVINTTRQQTVEI